MYDKMTDNKIDIIIKQVTGKSNDFLAYYHSDFLQATYSCYFHDSILGSVAMNQFSQMIGYRYGKQRVDFTLSDKKITFTNPYLLDIMCCSKKGVLK